MSKIKIIKTQEPTKTLTTSSKIYRSNLPNLVGIFVNKSLPEGQGDNLDIKKVRPVTNIIEVAFNPIIEGSIPSPAIHLSPSSHPRFDLVPEHVMRDFTSKFLDKNGTFRSG